MDFFFFFFYNQKVLVKKKIPNELPNSTCTDLFIFLKNNNSKNDGFKRLYMDKNLISQLTFSRIFN